MAWLSRVNFISSDTLSFSDINNLGNDIRAWGDNVNGGGYTLSNVVLSASSGTMATVTGGTGAASTLTIRSTSGAGTTDAIVFQTASQSERMRITTGGNVGIATPSPVLALHVVGTQGGPATSGTTPTGTARFVTVNSAMDIGSRSNGNTWMQATDRTNLAISYSLELNPNGGNVCVGGSTTPRKFTVYEGTAATADVGVRIEHVSNKPAYLEFVTTQRTANFGLGNFSGPGNTGSMQLVCDGGFNICPSGTGNVSIGMANPAYQLQLSTDSAAKPSTNTWTIASDERLKTVLGDYEKGLDAICALRPVRYEYNGLGGMVADGKEHISIVAQEAREVFPECIGTFSGKLHEDDEEETELLNYNGHAVTFALINAIKELKARLDALA